MRNTAMLRALSVAAFFAAPAFPVFALSTVLYQGTSDVGLEAQGFNGRIVFQSSLAPSTPASPVGVTSDGTNELFLSNVASTSTITRLSPNTGATLSPISVSLKLDDIAYSNGILYGIVSSNTAMQIVAINSNGTTSTILSQAVSTYSGTWRLSGASTTSELLAVRNAANAGSTNSTFASLINPTAATASPFPITSTSSAGVVKETVMNAAGTAVTVLPTTSVSSTPTQTQLHLPDGAVLSTLPVTSSYGSSPFINATLISDEFDFAWSPTQHNALTTTAISTTTPSAFNRLYRTPFVWQGSATSLLTNGIAPDGTALTNVIAANPFTITAPSPMQATLVPDTSGTFTNRSLGTGNFSVNLATAARGVYTVDSHAAITATYSYNSITQDSRAIDDNTYQLLSFGYDPISSNIIGNGDFELSNFGWNNVSNPNFSFAATLIAKGASGNHVPWLTPSTSSPMTIAQTLELPTSSTPMLFSFDYRLDSFPGGSDTLNFTINGINIANLLLTTSSTSFTHFQILLSDPALENLTNADFRITASGSSWAYVDNLSLTAVPEPASLTLLALPAMMLLRKKRSA